MKFEYKTRGVCSQAMQFEIEDNILKSLNVIGGCNGNLQGISSLVQGMDVDEVIRRLKGIRCGYKDTSCPDQLATALEIAKEKMRKQAQPAGKGAAHD